LLLVFSLMIEDVKLNEFYLMLCFRWLATGLTCPLMMSSHVWWLIVLIFGFFDGLYMIEFIEHLSYPSEASQLSSLVLTLVFPKLGSFHPNKGCSF
jgi:cyanate permease